MASIEKVKKYLAYWFQLGKKVIINNGREEILPAKIYHGHTYSDEFEECWRKVNDLNNGDCYLENTLQTIQQLLSSQWDIISCSRCEMPVPMIELGIQPNLCTCNDLNNWPNNELPLPKEPINSKDQLNKIRQSLLGKKPEEKKHEQKFDGDTDKLEGIFEITETTRKQELRSCFSEQKINKKY